VAGEDIGLVGVGMCLARLMHAGSSMGCEMSQDPWWKSPPYGLGCTGCHSKKGFEEQVGWVVEEGELRVQPNDGSEKHVLAVGGSSGSMEHSHHDGPFDGL